MKTLFFRRPFKYAYFHATLGIILINVLVYGLSKLYPLLPTYLALSPRGVIVGHFYWEFVSYMFTHYGFSHLLFNMLGLLFFGIPLERQIGSKEFLMYYFVCGIVSGLLSFAVFCLTKTNVFLLGASGAIYAVLFGFAVGFPHSTIYIWGIIPVPAPILVALYAAIEVISEVFGTSNTAHLTHLFGFLAAWIYFLLRMGIHPIKVWKNALKK